MKKKVDFKQAEMLDKAGVHICSDDVVTPEGLYSYTAYEELPENYGKYFAPNISDLLEWIEIHSTYKKYGLLENIQADFENYGIDYTVLIDALVKLVIKIKKGE